MTVVTLVYTSVGVGDGLDDVEGGDGGEGEGGDGDEDELGAT